MFLDIDRPISTNVRYDDLLMHFNCSRNQCFSLIHLYTPRPSSDGHCASIFPCSSSPTTGYLAQCMSIAIVSSPPFQQGYRSLSTPHPHTWLRKCMARFFWLCEANPRELFPAFGGFSFGVCLGLVSHQSLSSHSKICLGLWYFFMRTI